MTRAVAWALALAACAGSRPMQRIEQPGTLGAADAALAVRPAPGYAAAKRVLGALVARSPTDRALADRLALVHSRLGRHADAASVLARWAAADPVAAAAHARALRAAGRREEAARAVDVAATRWPDALALRWERVALRADGGDRPGAIEELRESFAVGRSDAAGWTLLGELYRAAGQPGAAEEALRRAIALDAKHAPARSALAVVLLARGDGTGAAAEAEAALHADGDDLRAGYTLGVLHFRQGQYAKAKAHFERAHGVWPASVLAHRALAETLVEMGKLDAAERELGALLKAAPRDGRGWCTLARVDVLKGAGAARALERYRRCESLLDGPLPNAAARSIKTLEEEARLQR